MMNFEDIVWDRFCKENELSELTDREVGNPQFRKAMEGTFSYALARHRVACSYLREAVKDEVKKLFTKVTR
jgi:hypothetical protein